MNHKLLTWALLLALVLPSFALARTKLVTLPDRSQVVVNMDHPDYTLLLEERAIPLQQGTNYIDFSWQGVSIDKDSIRLEILGHPGDGDDATKIVNVGFPPNEAALTWQIYSPEARTERMRVSYLLSGITREASYEMTVNREETEAVFRQFLQMTNTSGEDLASTIFRLPGTEDVTRTVVSGESRRFPTIGVEKMPLEKVFIARPEPYRSRGDDGEIIALVYEIANTEKNGLGVPVLEFGKARIFGETPQETTIFLGEDYLAQTPVGEDAELTLGTMKDVLLKRNILSDRQENQRRNNSRRVVLYDRVVHLRYEVENFKDEATSVRVIERIPVDARLVEHTEEGVRVERKSGDELQVTVELEPRPKDADKEVPVREINLVYRVDNVLN